MKSELKIQLVLAGLIGAIFGFIASQYFPLFGGLYMLGMPYSQARLYLAPGHCFLFAAVGIVIVLISRYAKRG